jgi:protein-disulfide isomerase
MSGKNRGQMMNANLKTLAATIGLCATALGGAAVLAAPAKPGARAQNWNQTVTRTPLDSYVLGNPAAPVKLVAYISYTCSHCANFETESDAQLRLGFIAPGKGSLEVRSFLRDPIDLTVALLTHCGPPGKFFGTHAAFLRSQATWLAPAMALTEGQKSRWSSPDFKTRTRAIASDLKFYDIMARRGFNRGVVDRCLADQGLADRLAKHTKEAADKDFVAGTPSFLLNGVPLAGTSSWETLKPQVEARLR